MVHLIRITAYIWITSAMPVMLLSYGMIVYIGQFGALREMLSPLNFANLVATVLGLDLGCSYSRWPTAGCTFRFILGRSSLVA